MANEKFLMLHVGEKDSQELLKSSINDGVERGLFIRSSIPKEIIDSFKKVKARGYFPVGIVVDDDFNMEILFNRHPKQTNEMRMVETKPNNPLIL